MAISKIPNSGRLINHHIDVREGELSPSLLLNNGKPTLPVDSSLVASAVPPISSRRVATHAHDGYRGAR